MLGRDELSLSLRLRVAALGPLNSSKRLSERMQGPLVVEQPQQKKRLKNRRSALLKIRPRRYQRGDRLLGVPASSGVEQRMIPLAPKRIILNG